VILVFVCAGCARSSPDQVGTAASASRAAPTPIVAHDAITVPPPGDLLVEYTTHDGGTATATLDETGTTASLADGSALFSALSDGSYTVEIDVTYPNQASGDTGIGAATVLRSHAVEVHAGDHVVVSCDDTACTGTP
jgi:hypothetical protein